MPDARPAKRARACVQAASLLGESGQEALAGTPADEAAFFDRTRPAQLGLGAKYVVHRHAVTGAASALLPCNGSCCCCVALVVDSNPECGSPPALSPSLTVSVTGQYVIAKKPQGPSAMYSK